MQNYNISNKQQMRLMIKPEPQLIQSFRNLIVIFQGCEQWITNQTYKSCPWLRLCEQLREPQRLQEMVKNYQMYISESRIQEKNILVAEENLKINNNTKPQQVIKEFQQQKQIQSEIVKEYCQILDEISTLVIRAFRDSYSPLNDSQQLKKKQVYTFNNEESIQRLDIIQEQLQNTQQSMIDDNQDLSQVMSSVNLNNSFSITNEHNDSSYFLKENQNNIIRMKDASIISSQFDTEIRKSKIALPLQNKENMTKKLTADCKNNQSKQQKNQQRLSRSFLHDSGTKQQGKNKNSTSSHSAQKINSQNSIKQLPTRNKVDKVLNLTTQCRPLQNSTNIQQGWQFRTQVNNLSQKEKEQSYQLKKQETVPRKPVQEKEKIQFKISQEGKYNNYYSTNTVNETKKNLQTLTNDKSKIREMIKEQRKILSDLCNQESQLKWKIIREVKELEIHKQRQLEQDEFDRYKRTVVHIIIIQYRQNTRMLSSQS